MAVSLVLAACAGAPAEEAEAPAEEAEAPAEEAEAPAEEAEAPAEEAEAPEELRRLRITATNVPTSDPTLQSSYADNQGLVNMYDYLVFPNTEGGVDPWVADSWDVSDDGLTWTFQIRQGVMFHNGSEMKASDVAFSMDRLQAFGSGHAYLYAGVVESSVAIDDYTVEFTLSQPSATFLFDLARLELLSEEEVMANIVTPGDHGELGDYGREYLTLHDAGSGPYMVKEMQPEESLTLEKFGDWWGTFAPNAPDEVVFLPIFEPSTQRTLFANREVEINDRWQSIESYAALDEIEGVDIAKWDGAVGIYLMVNTSKPPTDDVHFRRAMAYAYDYEAARQIQPDLTVMVGPGTASLPGYDPEGFGFIYERDLEKAQEELALSEYADQLDEVTVSIESAADAHDERFSLLFQANMAEIGINVEVVRPPWLTMYEHLRDQEASPNIAYIHLAPEPLDVSALIKYKYGSETAASESQNEWLLDEDLDARVAEALASVDSAEKVAIEQELLQYIADIAPTIYVAEVPVRGAYQSAYVNWPAAEGDVSALAGHEMFAAVIEVFPERRSELLQ
jgi:peptide/nickel transport system substrate-binding protein